jgi:hypothetical protein
MHCDLVAATIVFEGNMQWLVDIADPMPKEFQRDQPVRWLL